ncbi:MAG: T9SS type A sorting domain-containing protein [Candidatus Azobacteroides sp.]|nr:T9SS type A sorting domain-containing protein [Candidatus Azobacteroides sp.]
MKPEKLNKKTAFMPKWKHKGQSDAFSLAFMKLGMILMLCVMGLNVSAQTDAAETVTLANSGTEFYVAFGKNHKESTINAAGDNVVLVLRIISQADTEVTLSFTENPLLNITIPVPGGTIYDYTLTPAQADASYSGYMTYSQRAKKSIRVTATEPITLVMMNSAHASVETTLVWPVENWGTEYYNIGLAPYYYSGDVNNCNGYLLIAKENGTTVSGTVNDILNMDAGEVYHFYDGNTNTNTTGTHIVSDKPIAFYQTNTQAAVRTSGSTPVDYYNYNLEQLPPVNQWGTKFIAPANDVSSNDGIFYAGFFRVYAKENNTLVTAEFANGTTKTYTINNSNARNRYVDIILDIKNVNNLENNTGSKACYITSDKPVGICSIHTSWEVGREYSQPAIAWLPPLEQKTYNVLMSPLDFNSEHVYIKMSHFFTVIVPTASKDNTTVSLNGGSAQPVGNLSQFTWMEHNIGGSGYSAGRYYFGDSNNPNCGSDCYLNTIALVSNPDGLIMLAYGQGSYTKYFYSAGSASRDLAASFTVNGETYYEMDGKTYCNTSDFTFAADSQDPNALNTIVWTLNEVEIPGSGNQKTVTVNNLPDGYYTVKMLVNNKTYTTHFYAGGSPVIWTPEANSDSDKNNWNNAANWTPALVPSSCHNVFIPGNSTHYPLLTSRAECRDIYFMQGGELGRPDFLTYEKARVQYNFGLLLSQQTTANDNKDFVTGSGSTADRMLYSAAVSAPLGRERWYAFSAPLRGIVTGDLSFGGFPLTFMKKFGPASKDDVQYPVGEWTTPYTSLTETFSPTEGFGFYMYGYSEMYDDTGCLEYGLFNDLNDLDYLSPGKSGRSYGIKQTNGVLELPFFADPSGMDAHRTQEYDGTTRKSTFYYISDGSIGPVNSFTGRSTTVDREDNNGNYRFIAEKYVSGSWNFQNPIHHDITGLNIGDEFLVGNPYMSSIDMAAFCLENAASVEPEFHIWNGVSFDTYGVNTTTGVVTPTVPGGSPYVAPLQGFFLTYKGGDVLFDVEKISTVRPTGSPSNLRNAKETGEENILRIKAENDLATSYALVGYREGADNGFIRGKDVQKLFSPYDYVPEVYTLAGKIPADINFINDDDDVIVPLGIKTEQTGEIRLTFTGMDNYNRASEIVLIDMLLNKEIDLSGLPSYVYSFENKTTGIQNDRFLIRFRSNMASLSSVEGDECIQIYSNLSGILINASTSDPIMEVQVCDLQGRILYEKTFAGITTCQIPGNFDAGCVIVRVETKDRVKSEKVIR